MSRSKIYEALLVISTALLAIYIYGVLKHGDSKEIFIYLSCGIGISGIFIKPIGKIIAWAWYKLADQLSRVMSKIVLTLVYVLILIPVATLFRLSKKDSLRLKRRNESNWISREHLYSPDDLRNVW
jgi:hypothetical protein